MEGAFAAADEHFTRALELAETIGSVHERSLTLVALAELRLREGQTAPARELIETARSLCLPMNATLTLARIARLEAHLPSVASQNALPVGLTPREAEVLRLLATGLANAEIAGQLSLSSRTIDTHLTSIYAKLGVTSRGAAIRFALEHNLS